MGIEPKIGIINSFIESKLKHFANIVSTFDPKKKPKQAILEEGFVEILENIEKNALSNTGFVEKSKFQTQPQDELE